MEKIQFEQLCEPRLCGTADITLKIMTAGAKQKKATNDFHWTPESQQTLRAFIAKCATEFGGKKASKVMEILVKKWLKGKVKVHLD